jgi:histidinol-phosphatase (PHP family)
MALTCDYHTHPQGHQVRPYTAELLQPWVDRARQRGIRSLAFTDHDRYLTGVNFDVIEILRAQNPDMQILAGIELDNDPVTSEAGLRWVEKHWDDLDFVLGSVHYLPGESEMFDGAAQSKQLLARGAELAFAQYVEELSKLIRRGQIDCLAHLDLVKIHGLRPAEYDPLALFAPTLALIKRHGLAIEASTAGWRKTVREQYPGIPILAEAKRLGIPITTASDAHSQAQVAEDFDRLGVVLGQINVTETVTFLGHRITIKNRRADEPTS